MSDREIGVEKARAKLGPLVDDAALDGQVTYLTKNGRRHAAIVPLAHLGESDGVAPLRLAPTGPGSRPAIIDYVRSVIEQRTTPDPDTNADRLARAITTSVLHRLGAGYPAAVGETNDRHDVP